MLRFASLVGPGLALLHPIGNPIFGMGIAAVLIGVLGGAFYYWISNATNGSDSSGSDRKQAQVIEMPVVSRSIRKKAS